MAAVVGASASPGDSHASPIAADDGVVSAPAVSLPDPPNRAHFWAGGSFDYTGDVQLPHPFGYLISGFLMSAQFTASGDTYPLFPDSFVDLAKVVHDRRTALVADRWLPISFVSLPTVESTNGGSFELHKLASFWAEPHLEGKNGGAVHLRQRLGINVRDVSVRGGATVGENYGLHIEYLSNGSRNAGIVNHSITAHPPSRGVQQLRTPSDQIVPDQGIVEVQVTAGAKRRLTLTSTPTVLDGIEGQSLTLVNVGTGVLRLTDFLTRPGTHLRLPRGKLWLGQGDVVTLYFSKALRHWVATSVTNNRSRQAHVRQAIGH